jgi:hypothetical protein
MVQAGVKKHKDTYINIFFKAVRQRSFPMFGISTDSTSPGSSWLERCYLSEVCCPRFYRAALLG